MVALLVAGTQPAGAASDPTRYQVQRGESLSAIAAKLGVSVSSLVRANSLANPDLVYAGTWLRVPDGSGASGAPVVGSSRSGGSSTGSQVHVIRLGETLSSIAARYGLATATMAKANGISNPNRIYVGERLSIPAGGGLGGSSGGGSTTGTGGSSSGSGSSVSGLPLRLQNSPSRLALMPLFDKWSAAYGAPADLVKAVTWLESGWQSGVVSSTGAVGIGQLMPSTVVTINKILGTNLSPWRKEDNIRMSARYIALLLSATGGNTARALAGYYQGLASIERNGLYPSTLAYIDGVLALRHRF